MDCLACGPTSSRPSGEHVFSDWLLREFKGHHIAIGLYRGLPDGSRERVRKEYDLDSFRLKRVCECCNNGWMNDLENAAKPLILGLIRRTLAFDDLSEEDRRTLTKWAAKTAIIESHSVGAECPIDSMHLKRIRMCGDGFPGRFAVAACLTGRHGFGHMQVGVIRDLLLGEKVAGNIIVIALPELAFVCAFPAPLDIPYECRCVKSLLTPLWPSPHAWRDMRQTPMPEKLDDLESLAAMAERIELFHDIKQ